MSLMSKIRIPRIRSGSAASGIGSVPQSTRLLKSSTDAKRRSPWTDTSFCHPGQTRAVTSDGDAGFEISQIWMPLKFP